MKFKEAFDKVNKILNDWGEQGVAIAGETENEWIFKGHVVKDDYLSGSCVIMDKSNGEIRLFNAGRYEDREVTYNAKQINLSTLGLAT